MKKEVLVTGSEGQLARTIHELFNENTEGIHFTFVSKSELDITNAEELKRFFSNKKFDYCINCAAYTNVEQAEKTPEAAFDINSEAVKKIAEQCKINEVVLIHISTDYVFDGTKNEPYDIDDPTNPINQYGLSKLRGELYIRSILKNYFIVRTSWLYSKKYGKNFYKTILNKAQIESALYVTSVEIGCPTDTINLAHYIFTLILNKSDDYGIKHCSDGVAMSWFEFAGLILRDNDLLDRIKLVKQDNYRTFAKRPKYSVLRNS